MNYRESGGKEFEKVLASAVQSSSDEESDETDESEEELFDPGYDDDAFSKPKSSARKRRQSVKTPKVANYSNVDGASLDHIIKVLTQKQ